MAEHKKEEERKQIKVKVSDQNKKMRKVIIMDLQYDLYSKRNVTN